MLFSGVCANYYDTSINTSLFGCFEQLAYVRVVHVVEYDYVLLGKQVCVRGVAP
jgi:hypothetical protein